MPLLLICGPIRSNFRVAVYKTDYLSFVSPDRLFNALVLAGRGPP